MAARQRGDGTWEARRQIARVRVSGYGPSAELAERDLVEKLQSRGLLKCSTSTLRGVAISVYAPTIERHSYKWREQVAWALDLHILPVLGSVPVEDLTRHTVQAFLLGKLKTLSRTSVGHLRKVLCAVLTIAEADGLIPSNPVRHVKLPAATAKPKTALTPEQIGALLSATRGHPVHRLAVLAGLCGLRLGEAQAFRPSDVREGFLSVRGTKTASAVRHIPIPESVARELRGTTSFSNPRRSLASACFRAQIPSVTPHLLRHSFNTGLQRLGADIETRSRLMGHRVRGVNAVYSHAEESIYRRWIEAHCAACLPPAPHNGGVEEAKENA